MCQRNFYQIALLPVEENFRVGQIVWSPVGYLESKSLFQFYHPKIINKMVWRKWNKTHESPRPRRHRRSHFCTHTYKNTCRAHEQRTMPLLMRTHLHIHMHTYTDSHAHTYAQNNIHIYGENRTAVRIPHTLWSVLPHLGYKKKCLLCIQS